MQTGAQFCAPVVDGATACHDWQNKSGEGVAEQHDEPRMVYIGIVVQVPFLAGQFLKRGAEPSGVVLNSSLGFSAGLLNINDGKGGAGDSGRHKCKDISAGHTRRFFMYGMGGARHQICSVDLMLH
jgi:hypothetical protein